MPLKRVAAQLAGLPRQTKKALFFVHDVALAGLAFAVTVLLFMPGVAMDGLTLLLLLAVTAAVVFGFRLPWLKLGAFDATAVVRLAMVAALTAAAMALIALLRGGPVLASLWLLFGVVFFGLLVLARVVVLQVLNRLTLDRGLKRVAIYGAGTAGIQLAATLHRSTDARPVGFIDDNPNLHRLVIGGLPVGSPRDLESLQRKWGFEEIWLSIPSLTGPRRDEILASIQEQGFKVRATPSLMDLLMRPAAESPNEVTPLDLLGRESVALDHPDIARTYLGKTVMVTGAGGSIGSELCRQLAMGKVATLILFEHSEFALYTIERELLERADCRNVRIVTRLGSVADRVRLRQVLNETRPDVILHAAAYKHVPIIEANELEGARNNILGTRNVVDAARAAGVARMILISTDKAVRPTNIMGATKRIAEQLVQDAQTRSDGTLFSMVRFGNVLGSSGSVLPLFQRQIQGGGPVTVTHPEVTRFFMTIPEAARLVLLAGTYAQGGDVFVLDMGEPRRIADLARQMILLSGRSLRDPETGLGDIEIRYTGLRPGEELYEELLISGDNLVQTPHPKIMRANENMPDPARLAKLLSDLADGITRQDAAAVRHLIATHAEGYHTDGAA
ncbi:polysaccharide biosynthesis protein [Paracoccus sp. p3-h83]|uniref:polysaccharide biosynthesis protein n=1 Tax=Paracoccus sp. p3-h83 TaxID=3342805 RepID=UPI0035B97B72